MKSELAIKREINRLERRSQHLSERISKMCECGDNYAYLYSEREQIAGRIQALIWVKNGKN